MSEEFEDVAVVETAPVESVVPVDTGVAYVPEALPSEVEATELNLNSADDVLKNNDQQVYNEINAPDRVSESAAPITAHAVAAKEEKKAEERSESFEAYEEQLKQIAARKEFMNKDHDFGGMKMSGADLNKLMDFYQGNPQMLDKLKEKMVKSGMSKDKVEKGAKEFQESLDIKKKEKDGTATAEDMRRYNELQKSEDNKIFTQQAVTQVNQLGLNITPKFNDAEAEKQKSLQGASATNVTDIREKKIQEANLEDQSRLAAYAHFSSAPKMGNDFGIASSPSVAANTVEQKIQAPISNPVNIAKIEAGNAALM